MAQVSTDREETKAKDTTYNIGMKTKVPFRSLSTGNYFSSGELCDMCNEIFAPGFRDYIGCKIVRDVNNRNMEYFELGFGHEKYDDDDVTAFSRSSLKDKTHSHILNEMRNRDNLMIHGDSYEMTQEGIDVFDKYIIGRGFRKKDGVSLKLNVICSDRSNDYRSSLYSRPYTISVVDYVDITHVIGEYFGTVDEDGSQLSYEVKHAMSSNPTIAPYFRSQDIYEVKRVNVNALNEFLPKVGFQIYNDNFNFVKANR